MSPSGEVGQSDHSSESQPPTDADDDAAPFPVSARPAAVVDELASGPLVLYLAATSAGTLGPDLRVDKVGGQVLVSFP